MEKQTPEEARADGSVSLYGAECGLSAADEPFTPAQALRLLAGREAARGLPCRECPHGPGNSPAATCPRLQACLRDQELLRTFAKGEGHETAE
jgi:hypothetical protein